jgi:hypothetical protein
MARLTCLTVLIVLLSSTLWVRGSGLITSIRKFDEFGDIHCEDEMARLDNFAIQLQNEPKARGVIIFYGGKTFRGKLPRRGEAEARAARLKPYLVQRRGIPAQQVTVINGGYAQSWHAELWIVPAGGSMPSPETTIPAKEIKFRKGKASPREFRCQI